MRMNMWQVCQPFPVIFTFQYIKCRDVLLCRDVYLLLVIFCLFSYEILGMLILDTKQDYL